MTAWVAASILMAATIPLARSVSLDGPAGRVTVTHRTQVELQVRVIRKTADETKILRDERLTGMAREPLDLALETTLGGQPIRLALLFRAEADQASGTLPLTVGARVFRPSSGHLIGRTRRSLDAPDGRLRLVDLWSAAGGRQRLVLALSASWREVPRVVPVAPEARPVDLVVEVLREAAGGGSPQLLERHRLSTLVGSPVSYTFARQPRTPAGAGHEQDKKGAPERSGRLRIEILPDLLTEGEIGLSIGIEHTGEDIYSKVPAVDVNVRHQVGPGLSVNVPLPETGEGDGLVFRVTPYF